MQTKTKISIIIALVFVVLVIGIFAGWKFVSIAGGSIGAIGAIFASKKSGNNDGRGNSRGIDGQLDKERINLESGESTIRDRQESIQSTETIIDRDRDLLEELQKRHVER